MPRYQARANQESEGQVSDKTIKRRVEILEGNEDVTSQSILEISRRLAKLKGQVVDLINAMEAKNEG
jgi:polyhydroxyalkanoate synthesis regulator phasin